MGRYPETRANLVPVVAVCLLVTRAALAGPVFETTHLRFDPLFDPYSVASGDLNGDTKPDLVAVGGRRLSTFVNLGDGSFRLQSTVVTSTVYGRVAVGDFNEDDYLDVVAAGSDTMAINLGNGDGTVGLAMKFLAGIVAVQDIAVGLLNGDAHLDVVIANRDGGTVVLLGHGDGTFQSGSPLYAYDTGGVALGDLNGDSIVDLVTSESQTGPYTYTGVNVRLGVGDGTFGPNTEYPTGPIHRGVALGDIDGDGDLDIAVAHSGDQNAIGVSILLGVGNGTFGPTTEVPTVVWGDPVALADLNEDGAPDLLVGGFLDPRIEIHLGNGLGGFGPAEASGYLLDAGAQDFLPGDFDSNGTTDVAVADLYGGNIALLKGNGDGTLGQPGVIPHEFTAESYPVQVALARLDADAALDAAVVNTSSNTISILVGAGDGTFAYLVTVPATAPSSIAAADLNSDGVTDLVTASAGAGTVTARLGYGNGTFQPATPVLTGSAPMAIVLRDFNADQKVDLALADSSLHTVSILLGNGSGTFGSPQSHSVDGAPIGLASGDFDGDGDPDLVAVGLNSPGTCSVLLNDGNGVFAPGPDLTTGAYPFAVVAGDFDGDGSDDVATTSRSIVGQGVVVHHAIGGAAFDAGVAIGIDRAGPLAVADLNGDGTLDLVALDRRSYAFRSVAWTALGQGDGTFGIPIGHGIPDTTAYSSDYPGVPALGDLTGDGRPDLVVPIPLRNRLAVLRNVTAGIPTAVAVTLVQAVVSGGVVRIQWHVSDADPLLLAIDRREEGLEWVTVAHPRADESGMVVFEDRDVVHGHRYVYRLTGVKDGILEFSDEVTVDDLAAPGVPRLAAARPNPFVHGTEMRFGLPRPGRVRVTLHDVTGRHVRTLVDEPRPAGWHSVWWDGTGPGGARVASGVYFARMEFSGASLVRKVVVSR